MGAALVERPPTESEIRSLGFEPEDYADDYVDCWPENWPAFRVFESVANQWRCSAGGVISLDYGPLFHRMDRLKLSEDDFEEMFNDVRHLESAALSVLQRKN